jgi:hypothetical protein
MSTSNLPNTQTSAEFDEEVSPVSPQRKTSAIARWSASSSYDEPDVSPPTSAMFQTLETQDLPDVCCNRCNTPVAETASPADGNIALSMPVAPPASAFKDESLAFQSEIGRGASGCVFKAQVKLDGRIVAVKRSKIDPAFCDRELSLLLSLGEKQPVNVVKLLGHYHVNEPTGALLQFLVFEFMPASLSAYLRSFESQKIHVPFEQTIACLDQIANGLAELHRHNICHRDLKPDNVLVNMEAGVIKICDLGSAKVLSGPKAGITYIGSRYLREEELFVVM